MLPVMRGKMEKVVLFQPKSRAMAASRTLAPPATIGPGPSRIAVPQAITTEIDLAFISDGGGLSI